MLPLGKGGYWEGGGVGWRMGGLEEKWEERRYLDGDDSLQLPATAESPTSCTRHPSLFTSPYTCSALIGGCTCWLMNRAEVWEIAP